MEADRSELRIPPMRAVEFNMSEELGGVAESVSVLP